MGQIISARLQVPRASFAERSWLDHDEDDDNGGVPDFGVRHATRRGPAVLSGGIALEEPEVDPVYAGFAVARIRPR